MIPLVHNGLTDDASSPNTSHEGRGSEIGFNVKQGICLNKPWLVCQNTCNQLEQKDEEYSRHQQMMPQQLQATWCMYSTINPKECSRCSGCHKYYRTKCVNVSLVPPVSAHTTHTGITVSLPERRKWRLTCYFRV